MRSGQGFSLLCPAQGFPPPAFKYVYFMKCKNSIINADPVGSKAPAFSSASKSHTFDMQRGQGFSLLCPAQGFPVPSFKYVTTYKGESYEKI